MTPEQRERKREYYVANRERIAESQREYYVANRERVNERNREYRAANRERIAESQREYRAANKDQIAEYRREYYVANRELIDERSRALRYRGKECATRHGEPWIPQEDVIVTSGEYGATEIAYILGRTVCAVMARSRALKAQSA
ncbi:hypothetical protein [Speluncibacter jeojiensis]|uniref:Uncharacterized protein n=1 Tax=Speluncibacter jeojiensis TaxID=2710754 RepID=A0A9X4LXU1_9ACTN|nr:hypothetical protein [Corynebacteriales bacterium D3-21]